MLPQVREFKYLVVLFMSKDKMVSEIKRISAVSAVVWGLFWAGMVKKELNMKQIFSIYQFICVHRM